MSRLISYIHKPGIRLQVMAVGALNKTEIPIQEASADIPNSEEVLS